MACKFGEYADSGNLMSRHLYFRHNIDVILGGISHQFAHLLLCVISLIWHLDVVLSPAIRSLFCKLWILLYLYTPSLVVNQVQVQGVELITGHLRYESLKFVEWDKGTGWVNHKFAK